MCVKEALKCSKTIIKDQGIISSVQNSGYPRVRVIVIPFGRKLQKQKFSSIDMILFLKLGEWYIVVCFIILYA